MDLYTHIIAYHANCMDGLMSAAIAQLALSGDQEKVLQFIPVQYGDDILAEVRKSATLDSERNHITFVDFCPPLDTLTQLADSFYVSILDHHATAKPILEASKKATVAREVSFVFDESKSGAGIAWDFFNPGKRMPAAVEYVQDRDLWRFDLPFSREVSATIQSLPLDLSTYCHLIEQLEIPDAFNRCVAQGEAILRYKNKLVSSIADTAFPGRLSGWYCACVHCPKMLASDVGSELNKRYPRYPAVMIIDQPDIVSYGIRTNSDDVSITAKELAESIGGGGHKNAAGAKISKVPFKGFVEPTDQPLPPPQY